MRQSHQAHTPQLLSPSSGACELQPAPVLCDKRTNCSEKLVRSNFRVARLLHLGFPGGSVVKNLPAMQEGNGNPLQCPCLENPRDGGAWWAAIYGVAQSWIRKI